MSVYEEWGFRSNPFETHPLAPDELGKALLVGRDDELMRLRRRLENPPRIPCLEGPNGVGKTSLVNVAAYTSYSSFQQNPDRIMLIPCRRVFQLRPERPLQDFVSEVYREVFQTLLEQSRYLEGEHVSVSGEHEKLDRWLNAPELKSFQAGFSPVSLGVASSQNQAEGFAQSGFNNAVRQWLAEIFPTPQSGGVVCVIDNLELLQTSDVARRQLEALRDELLTLPGLRWVLCGALGVVLGVASSPRLEGHLVSPIQVGGIQDEYVSNIFASRVDAFSEGDEDCYLPIMVDDFHYLYTILDGNLRSVLGYTDDYCQWAADSSLPQTIEEKRAFFDEWLSDLCRSAFESAREQLKPRAWRVFEDAVAVDGVFSPSDYEHFQFNSVMAFRPHVRDLEAAGLVVSTQDDGDKRRKTIQVTPKAWLVNEWIRANS